MKSLLLILILRLIHLGILHPEPSQDLVLNAIIINSGFTDLFSSKFYYVKLTVKNNTDSVRTFSIFSCSWQKSFVIDIDSMDFLYPECSSNIPVNVNLPAMDSLEFTTMLFAIPPAFEKESFRIGLVLLTEKELETPVYIGNPKTVIEAQHLRRRYLLTRKIYWSNPLSFNDRPLGYDLKKVFNWDYNRK